MRLALVSEAKETFHFFNTPIRNDGKEIIAVTSKTIPCISFSEVVQSLEKMSFSLALDDLPRERRPKEMLNGKIGEVAKHCRFDIAQAVPALLTLARDHRTNKFD